jgi:hypothetical protein
MASLNLGSEQLELFMLLMNVEMTDKTVDTASKKNRITRDAVV